MNILVTGATGFIGQRLCRCLKDGGHQIITLSQDLTKIFSLEGHFDVVVHLAAYNITNVGAKDESRYTAVNVEGTRHLLEAVKTDRLIYLSTTKVYKNEGRPLTEESPPAPQGPYAQSKLQAEEICRSLFKKESLVIFRSVNCLGFGQAPKAVVPVFFQKARANEPLDIISSPRTPMPFVYVEDLVDAIETAIDRSSVSGIFNISSEKTVTLEQLAKKIIALTHSSSVINTRRDAPEAVFSPVVCRKASEQLGWTAKTGWEKILERYAQS